MEERLFELWETDAGIDGFDAKVCLIGHFSSLPKVMSWLERRGYTYPEGGEYAHKDEVKRHCMGRLTYRVKPHLAVPLDPN